MKSIGFSFAIMRFCPPGNSTLNSQLRTLLPKGFARCWQGVGKLKHLAWVCQVLAISERKACLVFTYSLSDSSSFQLI